MFMQKGKMKLIKMVKIRNNTNRELVLYAGNPHNEEPDFIVNLKSGEDSDLPEYYSGEISIQEK